MYECLNRSFSIKRLTLATVLYLVVTSSKPPQPGWNGGGGRQDRTDSPAVIGRAALAGPKHEWISNDRSWASAVVKFVLSATEAMLRLPRLLGPRNGHSRRYLRS